MSNWSFKCPSCGANLEYQPGAQSLVCPYCGHTVTEAALQAISAQHAQQNAPAQSATHLRGYHCNNCGAEIVTEETTAATRCYYCHAPVVLDDRLSGEFQPDGVIPFALDRARAEAAFDKFLRGHRFVDRGFFSKAQREMISGVYYPYWLGDFTGDAVYNGKGTRVRSTNTGREIVTTTSHFDIHRAGTVTVGQVVRKALSKADRLLSDGIHPYTMTDMKPYAGGYLSGFLAEKRDVTEESAKADMTQEVEQYVPTLMRQGLTFSSLSGSANFRLRRADMHYVLLPAWVMTYKAGGKTEPYYYMLNGQTGKVCGKLPVARGKLAAWCIGLGALVAGLLCAGGALLW